MCYEIITSITIGSIASSTKRAVNACIRGAATVFSASTQANPWLLFAVRRAVVDDQIRLESGEAHLLVVLAKAGIQRLSIA
jgi:hypothetical protein